VHIVDRLLRDQPSFHSGGDRRWDALPGSLNFLAANTRPGLTTLETGCGASTVVIAASGADHTVISPDSTEHQLVQQYCASIDVDTSHVTFVDGFSDEVLPRLLADGVQLDLAFIDGAHGFPYPAVDWHYVSRMLKVGGRLLLDDVPIPAISVVYQYMRSEPSWRIDEILDVRTAAATLVDSLPPEDWTTQRFNKRFDYSYLPLGDRVKATTTRDFGLVRRELGRRFPALKRIPRPGRR